jgi:hypothetical protein
VRARKSLAVLLVLRRPPYRRLFSFVCVRAFRVASPLCLTSQARPLRPPSLRPQRQDGAHERARRLPEVAA